MSNMSNGHPINTASLSCQYLHDAAAAAAAAAAPLYLPLLPCQDKKKTRKGEMLSGSSKDWGKREKEMEAIIRDRIEAGKCWIRSG